MVVEAAEERETKVKRKLKQVIQNNISCTYQIKKILKQSKLLKEWTYALKPNHYKSFCEFFLNFNFYHDICIMALEFSSGCISVALNFVYAFKQVQTTLNEKPK